MTIQIKKINGKTITLVMIVKNESNVITRCLDSVKDYIDYWVICDTGSTDNTQKIIKKYFKKAKIPGELFKHEWKNFGHNRSLAIKSAKGKSDYSLLLDADFIFNIKDKNFKENLKKDGYQIRYDGGVDYRQTLLVNSNLDWKYIGVTHEYLWATECKGYDNLDDFSIDHKCDGGSRSDKFIRDIELLKKGLIEEPDNIRYMFYLAQSYKDTDQFTEAIKYYQLRIDKGAWEEEVYFSLFQIGNCKKMRGDDFNDYKDDLWKAYLYRPSRLEALYELVHHCRISNMPELGFYYGIGAIDNEYPKDILFIIKPIHDWMLFDELAICAYNINETNIAIKIYDKLKEKNVIPLENITRFNLNYKCFKEKLSNNISKNNDTNNINKVAIIIVNYNTKQKIDEIIKNIKETVKYSHDIILVDNGSDVLERSEHSTIILKDNIELTNGWLVGVKYANSLEIINNEKYFAYCFASSRTEFVEKNKDIVEIMVNKLKQDSNIVGIHPSLTADSKTNYKNMINIKDGINQELFFIENIFSCYTANWFNINSFYKELKYDVGNDINLGYVASLDNKKIILDNTIFVKSNSFYSNTKENLSEDELKNNMKEIFKNKYGKIYDIVISKKIEIKKEYINNNESQTNNFNINLNQGLSFLIRAKNEEKNIVRCLETLVEETKTLPDIEIIVVNNKSTDNTYEVAKNYIEKNNIVNIKLYNYDFDVCKIGNNSFNPVNSDTKTIATYYNWCLEKVTKYNVVKWDADFIVYKDNLKDMINQFKLNITDNNISIWFKGETLFEHNDEYLKKVFSFYDSYKIFSKKNGFKWEDYGTKCEYVNTNNIINMFRYEKPVFYEIFRTDVDEFQNKHILMDIRDKVDINIHTDLKRNSIFYNFDNKSQLEKINLNKVDIERKTYFIVYYGYHLNTGGTYVTLKTYVDYFLKNKDIVYIFERLPCDDEINKLKPTCIISAQFANSDVNKKIKEWNIPHVVLTFSPNQYTFNGEFSKYPSLVTYSNSYIKSNDPLQKNGYIVRDPVDHMKYEVKKEDMEPLYITLIGSPPNIKGHNIFIELAKRFTTLKFMLVTHSNEYENIILPDNVKLQEYIKDIDELKNNVYSKIKVLLLPSIKEAYGRVVLEAIASSIPCIISDYPGLSDATYQMSNYINDYENIDKWEEELKRVLENYEDEVEKSNKIKLKLDFKRDIKYFNDLVLECIKKHNESNVSVKIINDIDDIDDINTCKEIFNPCPDIK